MWQWPRRPIVLLLLATLIADAVTLYLGYHGPTPDWAEILYAALLSTQTSLIALWMGLGRTAGPLRLLGTMAVITAWGLLSIPSDNGPAKILGFILVLMAPSGTIVAILAVARWRGLACRHLSEPAPVDGDSAAARQFSIARMFAWTSVLAILLATYKLAGLLNAGAIDWRDYQTFLEFIWPGRVLVALVALWTTLGQGPPLRRLPLLVIAEVTTASWLLFLHARALIDIPFLIGFSVLEAALLLGSLLLIRRAGYRVQWQWRVPSQETDTAEA